MFVWRAPVDHPDGGPPAHAFRVDWGFTAADAPEGVSRGDFAGLNLGGHVGDDPTAVETNRVRVAEAMGVQRSRLLFMEQCHGADVAVATGPWEAGAPRVDAVVTATPGLALGVLVADCTPILLADPDAGVVGAAHAGRPGLAAGIVDAVVEAARGLGGERLRAVVGPSVCGRCYEVPAEMRAEVARRHPVSSTVSWAGTPALDVAAGVVARLHDLGVPLTWVPGCTRESTSLYSYRRASTTGRFAGVVALGERHG